MLGLCQAAPAHQLPLDLLGFLGHCIFLLLKNKQTKPLGCIGGAFPRTRVTRESVV